VQIALGGLTSANYAALICPDFPYCQGQLFPPLDFAAFMNMQGFARSNSAMMTIHMAHRIGAAITGLYLMTLAFFTFFYYASTAIKINAIFLIMLLGTQITLGILNIVWLLPMTTALTHNMVAAFLLLTLLTLLKLTTSREHTHYEKRSLFHYS
jgi:cytochrome c oxidase assembly protein subunit 15